MRRRGPMRSLEADPGCSAFVWLRRCAASTRWLGRYVRATAWPLNFPGLTTDVWNPAPFGAALAEAVSRGLPGASTLPPHRPVSAPSPADQRRQDRQRPAPPPALERSPRLGALGPPPPLVGGRRQPAATAPLTGQRRAAGPILARLAGADRHHGSGSAPPRLAPNDLVHDPLLPARLLPDNAERPGSAMPPALASAAIGGRLAARLARRLRPNRPASSASRDAASTAISSPEAGPWQRSFAGAARATGQPPQHPETNVSERGAGEGRVASTAMPSGWRTPVAAPGPGLSAPRLLAELSPIPPASVWHRSPSPPVAAAFGARAVTAAPAFLAATAAPPASAASPPAVASVAGGAAGETPWGSLPMNAAVMPQSAAIAAGVPDALPSRPIIDPVDFAALLRAALLDDARRHGIEV